MHEVYAYGVVAPSTLVETGGDYPPEGGYAEVRTIHRSFGGEAAGSAYVLARLGVATKLAGTRLGADTASKWVVDTLSSAGVDCADLTAEGHSVVEEVVVSTHGERTIFATYGKMLDLEHWDPPSRAAIAASRLVCLDPFFGDASETAAVWCRLEDVPYVTIDSAPDGDLARDAAAIVVSQEFADRTFGPKSPAELFERYVAQCQGLVILTRGSEGAWFGRAGASPKWAPSFPVDVIDAAGAGDSFRAGVIRGLLRGDPDDEVVRVAAALAAMVCRSSPGVLSSPTEAELVDFAATADTL